MVCRLGAYFQFVKVSKRLCCPPPAPSRRPAARLGIHRGSGTPTPDTSKGVKVNNATVVKADVMASNGVIHAIDTVLFPR